MSYSRDSKDNDMGVYLCEIRWYFIRLLYLSPVMFLPDFSIKPNEKFRLIRQTRIIKVLFKSLKAVSSVFMNFFISV